MKVQWESAAADDHVITALIETAKLAGDLAMKHFHAGLATIYKKDGSPSSNADTEVEALIHDKLLSLYPDYAFTGEEGGSDHDGPPTEGKRRFLVDPIDGSRNFLNHRDDFAVSIAAQVFTDGHWDTTDGVVAIPVSRNIMWASKGRGAHLIDSSGEEHILKSSAAFKNPPLENRTIDISLRHFSVEGEASIFRAFRQDGAVFRNNGSSAIMLALVAGKGSDGVIMTVRDYDIAAAKLIALEAGAIISDFDIEKPHGIETVTVAGANAQIHSRLNQIAHEAAAYAAPKQQPQRQLCL